MTEVKTPSPELCDFLIERLPLLDDLEEHHMMKFADVLLNKGERQRGIRINHILDSMSYLCRVGIISYTEQFGDYGLRFHFKRCASESKIRSILGSPPPAPPLDVPAVKPEPAPEVGEAVSPKKKGKKKAKVKKEIEVPSPKKKKEKCCDNPHPVKNKKTGKRRCKNCGAKLKPKKKKE